MVLYMVLICNKRFLPGSGANHLGQRPGYLLIFQPEVVMLQYPRSITVFLPLCPELVPDPEAEKVYAQGLLAALRENYPESILEVCWASEVDQVRIDHDGDGGEVREQVLALTERFSRLWLLALQSVRNYLQVRLTHHARWLPTDLGSMASQLLIQEKLVDGSERILFSRGRLGQ